MKIALICIAIVAWIAWIVYELVHAPVADDNGHVIEDKT